ncbi:DUF11 domain-containing protein [Kutzneria viridogrisea]
MGPPDRTYVPTVEQRAVGRRVVCAVVAFLVGVASLGGIPASAAQPRGLGTERTIGPNPAYSGLAHGAITTAANTVITCATQPCTADNQQNSVRWVKTDPSAPGSTASSAQLTMPATAKVLTARLYWQLSTGGVVNGFPNPNPGDANRANQVAFKVPGGGYQRLTADTYDYFNAGGSLTAHAGVKDVTSLVSSGGTYTVADIPACRNQTNPGCWGGWSLVVAYEDDSLPLRYLQMWDGYQYVRSNTAVNIGLSGVKAVSSRTPSATLGVIVGDGDATIGGDYLEFGAPGRRQRLSLPGPDGQPTANNAFASRIDTVNADGTGSNVDTRDPNGSNNQGYDSRTIDVTGKIPAGATALDTYISTTGDFLFPQVLWLMSDAAEPDLQITKANDPVGTTSDSPPGWVTKGSQITYSFDVANRHTDGSTNDLDTATAVSLTDTLPTGLSYVAGSNQQCTSSGRNVICSLPDLAPGASTKVAFKVAVDPAAADGTKLDNTAGLRFKGKDTGREQFRTSNTVRNTVTSPRYELTKTVDKADALPGDTLTYTVRAANNGPIPAPGIVLGDTLPEGTTLLSATPSRGTVNGTTWTVGDLAVGESATLTVKVRVTEAAIGKSVVNRARGTSGPPGIVPPGNQCPDDQASACATTKIPGPGYTVTKSVDKASANPGDKVTYTLTATNNGQVVTDITVTDDLTGVLDDATYNGDAAPNAQYAQPKLTFAFGRVPAGQSVTAKYSVTVRKPDTGDHKLSNVVTPVSPGGSCLTCTTTTPVAGLLIAKSVDKSQANPGDTVKYTVTVTNTGQTVQDASFTDDLTGVLDDATYNADGAATLGSVAYTAPKLTWTGSIPVGGKSVVTYSVRVTGNGDHKLVNAVASDTPGNDCTSCSTTTPVSGVHIVKKASAAQANPGDTVTYTVTVTNTGQTELNASFADDLTNVVDDATYNADAKATVGMVAYAAPKLSWTGTLPIGGQSVVTYSVKVTGNGDHKLANAVTSDTPGNNCPGPDCSTQTLLPGMRIVKTVDKTQANPGDTVTYTVTVTNTGQTVLNGSFTDDLSGVLDDAAFNADAKATVGTTSYTAPKLTWIGTLPVGAQSVVTYSVKVTGNGDHKLANAVTSDTPGNNCADGSCTTSTPVSGLSIVKKVSAAQADPGDTVTYTVTVTNTGQTVQGNASFTDDLSGVLDDATFNADAKATVGTTSYTAPKLTWTGTLPIGAQSVVTYSVKVTGAGDHKLINSVSGGNSTTTPVSGVRIVKTVDKTQANPGDTVTYTVTVTNTGQTVLASSFTDDLTGVLDDATFNADAKATIGTTSYTAPKLSWSGSIPVGGKSVVTYSVKVTGNGDHQLVNSVSGGNSTTTPVSGLHIVKKADKDKVVPGERITYTVTVRNTGQTVQDNARFTDDLTSVLDDASYNNDANATLGTASYAAPKLSWTGSLPIGAQAVITYSVTVHDPDTGDKKLLNSVVSDTPGTNCPQGTTNPDCGSQVPAPGLVITKTADRQQAEPGQPVTYTITVTNDGQIDLPTASFTDDLTGVLDDASYTNDAKASVGTVSYAAPKLSWTGSLPVGASATVTYTVTVAKPITGDHLLRNVVSSDTPGNNCAPQSGDPRCTNTVALPGVEIVKTVSTKQANPGDTVTYTVTVTNTGQTVLDASFADDLSGVLDDATYNADAKATVGTISYAAPKLSWNGTLPIGAKSVVTYSVLVTGAGDHKLVNSVTGGNSTTTPVSGLRIVKKASSAEAKPGDTVTYTVTVSNTGQTVQDASFTDDLTNVIDDATYNADAKATVGATSYAAPKLTWTGSLLIGAQAVITYSVRVTGAGDHKLSNAVVSDTPGNNCPGPDCATQTLLPGLQITKTASAAQANPGDTITYTVTVRNTGQTAQNASFTDDLSGVLDDATFNADAKATVGATSYAAPKLTWTGALSVGAQAVVTYSVQVTGNGDHKLTNTVVSDTPGNNCADGKCGTTTPVSGLRIVKKASSADVKPGDTVTYSVTVTNTGQTVQDASFTDDLTNVIDDATYNADAKATVGTVSYTAPKLSWTGSLSIGAEALVTYSVQVTAAGDHKLSNTVVSDTPGNNCPGPDCSTETLLPGLRISKTVSQQQAKPGDLVVYTVTVTNTGQTVLNASFTDDLSGVLDDATYTGDAKATIGATRYAAPKLLWNGVLPVGEQAVVTYSVQVTGAGDHVLTNAVTSQTPGGNCPDPRCGTSTPVAGLKIVKRASQQQANPGDLVTYTVQVTNTGQTVQDNASFTDDLSGVLDDATYNADAKATVGAVDYAAPKLTWTGSLPIGAQAVITYSVRVTGNGDHKLVNTVSGWNCPGPDCATTTPVGGVKLVKTVDKARATAGDTVTYTVTVTNIGQTLLHASFTDDLSGVLDDATYNGDAKATIGAVGYTAPKLAWTGDLPVGGQAVVTYSVLVTAAGDRALVNVVTSDTPGGNCPGLDCGTNTPVSPRPVPPPPVLPERPGLASTGADVTVGLVSALFLLFAGALLVLAGRRRRGRRRL